MALMIGINIIYFIEEYIIKVKIDIGANFCQVDRIIHEVHEIDVITDGNHIWHGAIPSLINIDNITIKEIIYLLMIRSFHHIVDAIIKNTDDPIVWTRKYFNIASDSWNLFDELIRGINASILISNAAQVIIRLFLEIAINDLISIIK